MAQRGALRLADLSLRSIRLFSRNIQLIVEYPAGRILRLFAGDAV